MLDSERHARQAEVSRYEQELADAKREPRPVVYASPADTRDLDRMRRAMALCSEQYPASRTWVRMIEQIYNLELSGDNLHVQRQQPLP